MKHINKITNEAAGKLIVNELLSDSWDLNTYYGADYEGLKKPKYKSRFTGLLLTEQSNLCCYCMKEIELQKTTMEHIIPQDVSEDRFNDYLVVDELTDNVIFKGNFDKSSRIIPPPKYPHDIAYHNLVASCDSNAHCNHFRKNKTIRPFIYDSQVENKVKYNDNGIAHSDDYFNELAVTGISTSPLLIVYRKIWKILSTQIGNPNDVTTDDIEMIILTMEGGSNFTQLLSNFYGNPSKKEDLLKYKWFFDYYKRNNN